MRPTVAPGTDLVPNPTRSESVIHVFDIPAVTWALTAILLVSGSYHFLHVTRSHQLTDRINKSLHGLMNILMAAMVWNLTSSTMLAQIAVLAGAALWFVIQAVARPEFTTLCARSQGRLKCVYHGLAMAGAALMIARMGQVPAVAHEIVPTDGMPMSTGHHSMAAPAHNTATAAGAGHSPDLVIVLTVFFGAAAVVFIVLLLGLRRTKNTSHNASASAKSSARAEHGFEALGASVMALMSATMLA